MEDEGEHLSHLLAMAPPTDGPLLGPFDTD
jgi:hypothetical protein